MMQASGSNFPDDDILTDLGSAATRGAMKSAKETNALISAFARIQYKFNNRYLLTATYRADGSSKLVKTTVGATFLLLQQAGLHLKKILWTL